MTEAAALAVPTPVSRPRTPVFAVEAEVVVALREGQDRVEVLALDPVLVLAGGVAGVGAGLEHVDDDDLDLDGLRRQRVWAADAGGQQPAGVKQIEGA